MALVVKDRVKETSTSTGTGTITLDGAVSGFQAFSVIGDASTTYYAIVDRLAGTWEVGIGTYTSSGTTLSRDTVLESSNSGSLVDFQSGTKDVFVTYPAERSTYVSSAGAGLSTGTTAFTANGVVYASSTSDLSTGSGLVFDGTNLGIGTTTPFEKLHVQGDAYVSNAVRFDNGVYLVASSAGPALNLLINAYYNGTDNNYQYVIDGNDATRYSQSSGVHRWYNAQAGSASTTTVVSGVSYRIVIAGGNYTSFGAANNNEGTLFTATSSGTATGGAVSQIITWTQAMLLDSVGNVGIGASFAQTRLDVRAANALTNSWGTANLGSTDALAINKGGQLDFSAVISSGGTQAYIASVAGRKENATSADYSGYLAFSTATSVGVNTERMRLDSAGNLGLGVTPSAWGGTAGKALQINNLTIGQNIGFDISVITTNGYATGGSTYNYIGTASAAQYRLGSSGHIWYNAPSGTAGNAITFTQAMTLDASGNLGLGVTPSAWSGQTAFQLVGSSAIASNNKYLDIQANSYYNAGSKYIASGEATRYTQAAGQHLWFTAPSGTAGAAITFTQAMTLDASGNLGIGATSPGAKLDVQGAVPFVRVKENTTGYTGFRSQNDSGNFYSGIDSSTGSFYGSAYARVLYSDGAYPMVFYTNATERMRIDSAGNVTLSAGTANGVAYLNASKVVTSGSGLTFDGTRLGIGVAAPVQRLEVSGSVGVNTSVTPGANGSGIAIYASDFPRLTFRNATTGDTVNDGLQLYMVGANVSYNLLESGYQRWMNNNTEYMRLDSSGNLGLGVTPSAWGLLKGFDVSSSGAFFGYTAQAGLSNNAYFDGSNWKYKNTAAAAFFRANAGAFEWQTAASGTAGNAITFTQAMTLDASGNLGLGVTPSAWGSSISAFEASYAGLVGATGTSWFINNAYRDSSNTWKYRYSNAAARFEIDANAFKFYTAATGTAGNTITFTQAMTLDASGNLLVGTTSQIQSGLVSIAGSSASVNQLILADTVAYNANPLAQLGFSTKYNAGGTYTQNSFIRGIKENTTDGDLKGALTFGTHNGTSASERMRLDSAGNLKLGGTANRGTTAGTNHLDIFNGTAPAGTLTNGISIYSSSGEAYVMDAAGNATLFSPHDAETNEWIFKSKHTPTGKVLKIDVERLLRFVNDHFGLDAVQEFIED